HSFFFFFYSYLDHPDLHSFPTRRSSDLGICANPESEGERRDKRETGMLSQLPNGITNFSNHRFLFRVQGDDGVDSAGAARRQPRSEEHTSELQSRFDLVCRLLLEKKKQQ